MKKEKVKEVSVLVLEGDLIVGPKGEQIDNRKLKRVTKKMTDFPLNLHKDFPENLFEGPYEKETNREFYLHKRKINHE